MQGLVRCKVASFSAGQGLRPYTSPLRHRHSQYNVCTANTCLPTALPPHPLRQRLSLCHIYSNHTRTHTNNDTNLVLPSLSLQQCLDVDNRIHVLLHCIHSQRYLRAHKGIDAHSALQGRALHSLRGLQLRTCATFPLPGTLGTSPPLPFPPHVSHSQILARQIGPCSCLTGCLGLMHAAMI